MSGMAASEAMKEKLSDSIDGGTRESREEP
jgi:hypothetical protein